MAETEFVTDRQIYERVLLEHVPRANDFLWIGTSDLKDLHVDKKGRMVIRTNKKIMPFYGFSPAFFYEIKPKLRISSTSRSFRSGRMTYESQPVANALRIFSS